MTWGVIFSKAIEMARSKLKNPKMVMAVFLTVLVFVALYFVQKWTDLPVFDWTINVLKWIGNGIEYLFHKLMSLISN